tara:strand:+ start:467 stop:850 length:384 start_codon:yes stop_codon:yes gene_type:complete
MKTLSKLFILIVTTLFTSSLFADEIMKCKIDKNQTASFKLEENVLFSDKIFQKVGTKWIRKCPCHEVKNKSVECNQAEDKKCIKNNFGDLQLNEKTMSLDVTIDFEIQALKYKTTSNELIEFKCKLL